MPIEVKNVSEDRLSKSLWFNGIANVQVESYFDIYNYEHIQLIVWCQLTIFMAHRAIPVIAFHNINLYIYLYILCVYHKLVCIVYVVKKVVSFQVAWSINGCGA